MHVRPHFVLLVFAVVLASFFSCTSSTSSNQPTEDAVVYFNLESYFKAEAARLAKTSPEIKKVVSNSGDREEKKVTIADWNKELDLFISADINKPAWRGKYTVDSAEAGVVYKTLDASLPVQYIIIEKDEAGEIKKIEIQTAVKNMLYSTEGRLVYFPDSLYEIRKRQHVRIIGERDHHILGLFDE